MTIKEIVDNIEQDTIRGINIDDLEEEVKAYAYKAIEKILLNHLLARASAIYLSVRNGTVFISNLASENIFSLNGMSIDEAKDMASDCLDEIEYNKLEYEKIIKELNPVLGDISIYKDMCKYVVNEEVLGSIQLKGLSRNERYTEVIKLINASIKEKLGNDGIYVDDIICSRDYICVSKNDISKTKKFDSKISFYTLKVIVKELIKAEYNYSDFISRMLSVYGNDCVTVITDNISYVVIDANLKYYFKTSRLNDIDKLMIDIHNYYIYNLIQSKLRKEFLNNDISSSKP